MNRVELLEAASMHLAEAVILLAQAGEKRLAADAGEAAEIVGVPLPSFRRPASQEPHRPPTQARDFSELLVHRQ